MAYLDPEEAFAHFRDRALEGVGSHFPLKGKTQTLHLDKLEVKDELHPDDVRAQHKAKMTGGSFCAPVYGHLRLVNNETGKVVDQRRIRLAEIPRMTGRYSYVLDGQEWKVDNQWQLKPGAYTRRRQNGELETRFNVQGKSPFDVIFDDKSQQFSLEYNKSKLPLYPFLKTMGVDDSALEKSWGKEVLQANKSARGTAGALERFYKSDKRENAPGKEAAEAHFFETMQNSKMRPDATALTLGKPIDHVTGEALHLATEKLLKVQGGHPEDDRDSLIFKDLRSAGDFAHDKLKAAGRGIAMKASRKLNTATDLRDIVKFEMFNEPIRQAFHKNSAATAATQINPVEMISSAMQTTIMGSGGIQSEQAITNEAKLLNVSHFGFLDPINTPEGSKTGVTLRLPLGVKKVGNEPRIPLYNLKTGKTDLVSPAVFMSSKVVLPDQLTWVNGKPVPAAKIVQMAVEGNEMKPLDFKEAQYAMKHASQAFNMTSNLVPFMNNCSGGRISMAARHIEQSISLQNREAPLVQVGTGVSKPGLHSFEALLGTQASQQAPIDGVVHEIRPDTIVLKDKEGKHHEVAIYNNFPLNDKKSVYHSTPIVKVGDKVHKDQTIADTNYSKNGVLALGTNLRVAYIPYKGYNFEDGVVISETAAKKLSSIHMHKHEVPVDPTTVLDTRRFQIQHPAVYKASQLTNIGENGTVKVGSLVKPGDPLVLAMKPFELKDRTGVAAIRKSLMGSHADKSLRWEGDTTGEVVAVHHGADGIKVHVRTIEPMQVGDKLAGRYGNKGICTLVLPDHEMPHSKDGKPIEVALNPTGVPGRMNVGQLLETAAAKIAEKTGKTYIVENFQRNVDMVQKIKGELKAHGIPDTEELIDPVTGQSLGQATTGKQHILKLVHQVDKKVSVASGMGLPGMPNRDRYDMNLQPSNGQRIGSLGMYALLAHGAKANLREMQTWKGQGEDPQTSESKKWPSQHLQVWNAIQTGAPLPVPKSTFAFKKFEDMLRGAGVNVEKRGHEIQISPLTDKHILEMSGGRALPKAAERLDAKVDKSGELHPRPGGLFDEKLTGGHGGTKWSHIDLAEPIPNPVFEGPIQALTGLTQKHFDSIVRGESGITKSGALVDLSKSDHTGGRAIQHLLEKINVKEALAEAHKELNGAPAAKVDPILKKVKYLRSLDQLGLKPAEAYVLTKAPVVPPVLRPASPMADGNIKYADINQLYSEFALVNDKLKDPVIMRHLADDMKTELRSSLYDGMKAITGYGIPHAQAAHKGFLHQIAGSSPKKGFFQNVVVQKRQDLTMRSTIVPEPSLGLNQVGLPREHAMELFRPFLVKQLQEMGVVSNPLDAQKMLAKGTDPVLQKALQAVMDKRPVLLKRDPALHKYSVQGFDATVVDGNAIKIHPLVCGGFNADFDGDTMSVFVPIHRDAVMEAHRMKPTNNIFMESTGRVAFSPTLESAIGLYKLSGIGKETGQKMKGPAEVLNAVRSGKNHYTDVVEMDGKKTTAGRVLLSTTMPAPMQHAILHDLDMRINKAGLEKILTTLGQNHKGDFDHAVNLLKDMGNSAASGVVTIPLPGEKLNNISDPKKNLFVPIGVHTLSLDDFTTDKGPRDRLLHAAEAQVHAINQSKTIPEADKERRIVDIYMKIDKEIGDEHKAKLDKNPDALFTMFRAGTKPSWAQYKQMKIAPMLLTDSNNRIIPHPVTKSYSEGLDLAGYWTQMHGARRGSVLKVQETQEPGYLSKLLQNNTMDTLIAAPDCGTTRGISLSINEKDVHDRLLAADLKVGNLHLKAGEILTPDLVSQIRATDKNAKVIVRSPLKCEHEKGLCQKCVGVSSSGHLHEIGDNIGVMASHTLGERAVQLTLKEFHTGGVAGGGASSVSAFGQFQDLTNLPQKLANAASLAMNSGTVDKIEHTATGVNVWINHKAHHVGKDPTGMPLHELLPGQTAVKPWTPPKVGDHVEAGAFLSDPHRTVLNPHDLYKATGSIDKVQNHLAAAMYDLYKDEGIKRRHVEVVVKAMSNLTKVVHPGDSEGILRGEFQPLSMVQKLNTDLQKAGKKPIEHTPVLKGVSMTPLALQEDWMAKLMHRNLTDSIAGGAAVGAISFLHGTHPIPGLAFSAEFGLTKKDSLKPGYGHLKDVPDHHY